MSIWIRILAPARLKEAAAVLHQYQILNWKNVCVSQGGRTDGLLDEWAALVIDGQGGAVSGKLMPHRVNIRLFASHASRKKCALSTLDMTILLFVG